MSIEAIVSLIAVLGVALSALASLLISKQNVQTELKKLTSEIQLNYAGQLLQKRLESYPRLYALLSNFGKDRQAKVKINGEYLTTFLKQINEWDSAYAIFLSARAGRHCFQFRTALAKLCKKNDKEISEQLRGPQSAFMAALRELELSLKGDIGVFAVEFSPEKSYFDSYKAIAEAVKEEEEEEQEGNAKK